MSVTICHASISENGNAGWDGKAKAGDQTGYEVCTRSWYNKPWNIMIRYPDSSIAAKAAAVAKKLANSNLVGYDQSERNTLYSKLKKYNWDVDKYIASGEKCETDCSEFVYVCYCCFLPKMRSDGNAPSTSSMRTQYKSWGFSVSSESKYISTDSYLKIGDILVREGHHTAMAITNGSNASSSSNSSTTTTSSTKNTSHVGKGIGTATALSNMQIRSGSGTNYSSYGTISKGTKVEVLERLSNGWYKIVWTASSNGYAYTSNTTGKYYSYIANTTTTASTKTTVSTTTTTASSNTKTVSAKESAASSNKAYAGIYTATANLNIRAGAGSNKEILVTVLKGTKMANYGYYTQVGSTPWLYVKFIYNGITYVGFASKAYLTK